MKIGKWVIIKRYSEIIDGKEGEIVDIYKPTGTSSLIYKVRLESGRLVGCNEHQMKVIPKHINYSELLNIALSPLDKPWCEQITQRMKGTS